MREREQFIPAEWLDLGADPKEVRISARAGTMRAKLRPLRFTDLKEVIRRARDNGWHGNWELFPFVVAHGLMQPETESRLAKYDGYTLAKLAREVWLLTLRQLVGLTNGLLRLHGFPADLRVRGYRFSDLATPRLTYSIWKEMRGLDLDGYSATFVSGHVNAVSIRGLRKVGPRRRRRFLRDREEAVAVAICEQLSGEPGVLNRLPKPVSTTLSERLYFFQQLLGTLDWEQYGVVVAKYNLVVEAFALHSAQMGGLAVEPADRPLKTGVPMFISSLVRDEKSLPFLLESIATDFGRGRGHRIARHDRKRIGEMLAEVRRKQGAPPESGGARATEEYVSSGVRHFGALLWARPRLVDRLCFAFWEEYVAHRDAQLREGVRRFAEEALRLVVPDAFMLVEGESEEICYSHFLHLLAGWGRVRVVDCGGDSRVVEVFRRMLKETSSNVPLITVFDEDARRKYDDVRRMPVGERVVSHNLSSRGALEEEFPPTLHAKVLNKMYPGSRRITVSEVRRKGGGAAALKRVLRDRRRAEFDKVAHARGIVREIRRRADIPPWMRRVCEEALQLAAERRENLRGTTPGGVLDWDDVSVSVAAEWLTGNGR